MTQILESVTIIAKQKRCKRTDYFHLGELFEDFLGGMVKGSSEPSGDDGLLGQVMTDNQKRQAESASEEQDEIQCEFVSIADVEGQIRPDDVTAVPVATCTDSRSRDFPRSTQKSSNGQHFDRFYCRKTLIFVVVDFAQNRKQFYEGHG